MNGPHSVLEAALAYGGVPEEVRRSFRAEMGYELALWSLEFVEDVGLEEVEEVEEVEEISGFDELLTEAGMHLDKDPDLWMIRDERGDVVCGVSADGAMRETIERIARGHLALRKEIEEGMKS